MKKDVEKRLLIILFFLAGYGCGQVLGLSRDYPPGDDAIVDPEVEDDPTVDIDVVDAVDAVDMAEDVIVSDCRFSEPAQVTSGEHPSTEVSAAFLDGIWGIAWKYGRGNDGDIRFARVSSQGRIIGDLLEVIDTGESFAPDIAAGDSGFGVAWQERSENGSVDFEVQFAYISEGGTLITSDVHIDSAGEGRAMQPALEWNGSSFALAWQDSQSGSNQILLALLNEDGSFEETGHVISDPGGQSTFPDIAWTGSEYGVTWLNNSTGNDSVYFARVDASGEKTGSDLLVFPSEGASNSPAIRFDFSGYAMAWADNSPGNMEIFFTRLDLLGSEIIDTVRITSANGTSKNPDLVYIHSPLHGNLYHLCWEDNRSGSTFYEIYATSINESGVKHTHEGMVSVADLPGGSSYCRVLSSPDANVLFWSKTLASLVEEIFFTDFSCTD